jgi:hypothetical protein
LKYVVEPSRSSWVSSGLQPVLDEPARLLASLRRRWRRWRRRQRRDTTIVGGISQRISRLPGGREQIDPICGGKESCLGLKIRERLEIWLGDKYPWAVATKVRVPPFLVTLAPALMRPGIAPRRGGALLTNECRLLRPHSECKHVSDTQQSEGETTHNTRRPHLAIGLWLTVRQTA